MEQKPDTPFKSAEQKYEPLPLLALCLGGGLAGFLLRLYMNTHCYENGLLHRSCAVHMLLILLSVITLGGLAFLSRGMGRDSRFHRNYGPSAAAAGCCFIAAALLLYGAVTGLSGSHGLALAVTIGAFPASACLVFFGISRLNGRRCAFLFPLGASLFLALRLLYRFRLWSADPILTDYYFAMLANVSAMLAAYHTAGFCLDKGSRRRSIFFSLAAIYFCLICLADGKEGLLFHCAVIFWMAGALPRLKKPRLRRRPGGQIVPAEAPPSELS